jgi:uncharacterized protein (TIGR04255 family)
MPKTSTLTSIRTELGRLINSAKRICVLGLRRWTRSTPRYGESRHSHTGPLATAFGTLTLSRSGISFENPPLVELIAELRWALPAGSTQAAEPGGVALPVVTGNVSKFEEFFMRFGGGVQQLGFVQVERLTPSNFPLIAFQPIFRFRPLNERTKQVLYQVGAGMFSANAVPPYKSWDEFGPVVRNGVRALLNARDQHEKNTPFVAVSLRYIDAFGPSHTNGMHVGDFVQKVLGFRLELPRALSERIAKPGQYKPLIQVQMPLANGMLMHVQVGEGLSNKLLSIIMDWTVAATSPVGPTEGEVMNTLDSAHTVIHDVFLQIIEPIRDTLRPRGA